jgi:molybdopterin synthase sulfur carrier subunit
MQITVKLNASLRQHGRGVSNDGTLLLEIEENATAREVLQKLGIPLEKVKMIILNGKGADFDSILSDGDRIAFFPPEMAFNMYVALSFRRDLIKKSIN